MPRTKASTLPPGITRTESGKYLARFLQANGKKRSKVFTNLREAQVWKSEQERAVRRSEYVDPKDGRQQLSQLWAEWMATRNRISGVTRARDVSVGVNHVLTEFGSIDINRISSSLVQKWLNSLGEEGLSEATIGKARQLLFAALTFAHEERRIARLPRKGIVPKVDTYREMRYLTEPEIADLAAAIHPHYRVLVLVAAYTGLRWGEIAGLQTQDLDLESGRLQVRRTLKEVSGKLSLGPPKTPHSLRTVSLPPALVGLLHEQLNIEISITSCQPPSERETYSLPADYQEFLVFMTPENTPLRRGNFRRRIWLPAVEKSVGQPMRFHDLRHTHAALLIAQAEHPHLIQKRLGHKSMKTTFDRYGHLMPALDDAAAGRLNEGLAAVVGTS